MTGKYQDRTDAKLRYARLHLNEILHYASPTRGEDFELAHVESLLFHVVGAKDSLLQEINDAYGRLLQPHKVNEESLKRTLTKRNTRCEALDKLLELESDDESWLAQTIELRNQGTHRCHIARSIYLGGEEDGQRYFINPRTSQEIRADEGLFLADCIDDMTLLVRDLRLMLPAGA